MLIEAEFNRTTHQILSAAIEVHQSWAPVSSNPDTCLFPLVYKGIHLDQHYRIDLIVEDAVVVEVKSVATTVPVHKAQALTYMKLTDCSAGLVINFNVPRLMDGVPDFC